MADPQVEPIYTIDEYLDFEERATEKHEYIAGRIYPLYDTEYAVAGGEGPHSQIAFKLASLLDRQLPATCRGYSSDVKILIESIDKATYTDLTIVCGDPQFAPHKKKKRLLLLNPRVIFEVLSPTTEKNDRGIKWEHYQLIQSLSNYLLVSVDKPQVEHFVRSDGGIWTYTRTAGIDRAVSIESINCDLQLKDIYDRIEFEPGDSGRASITIVKDDL